MNIPPKRVLIPDWMRQQQNEVLPEPGRSYRNRQGYLEKTLSEISQIMARDMNQSHMLKQHGLLQRLDPRVKVIGIFLLLLAIAHAGSIASLLFLHGVLLVFVLSSRIPVAYYCKRIWLSAALFAGLMLLPGITNAVTPGETVFTVFEWQAANQDGYVLSVTRQGLVAAGQVMLRTAGSIGSVLLLILTTRWDVFTKTLGYFGLPAAFVMILDLTYRYLFLFLMLMNDYLLGRKSRIVAREKERGKLAWIGMALAGFFRMSVEYSQEVAAAMRERGYNGMIYTVALGRINYLDVCFLAMAALLCWAVWGGIQFVYAGI